MQLKVSEKSIQAELMGWLRANGFFVWRNNSGMLQINDAKYGHRRMVVGLKGSPDIIGMTKDGRFLGVEVKAKGGYQNINQKEFERLVKESNGIYIVARSLADLLEGLTEHGMDTLSLKYKEAAWAM